MFERFTKRARDTVIGAQEVALREQAAAIGSEHLLRALYETGDVGRGLLTAAVYAGVFWLMAWARFASKDISS